MTYHVIAPEEALSDGSPVRKSIWEGVWERLKDWGGGVLRAMALGPIGDIANPTLTELDQVTIFDDWVDGDHVEYDTYTNQVSVGSNTVYNGTYSAEHTTPADGKYVNISVSGLDNYPSAGDTFRYYYYPTDAYYVGVFGWGYQGTSIGSNGFVPSEGGYAAEPRDADNLINLYLNSNSSAASGSLSHEVNQWNYCKVEWTTGGNHNVSFHRASDDGQLGSVSGSDGTYTSGGIGFGQDNQNSNTVTCYYDYIHKPT